MKKVKKEDRKLLTDFYMWMVENEYDHNIRIRVETKAELFLRDKLVENDIECDSCGCSDYEYCGSGEYSCNFCGHFPIVNK